MKLAVVKQADNGLLAVAVGAVALALTACASATPAAAPRTAPAPRTSAAPRTSGTVTHSTQPRTGVVTGTLGIYGGTLETNDRYGLPQAGTVRLIEAHGHIDVSVGKSGQFSVRVPAGRYEVTAGLRRRADWPMGSCVGLFGPDVRYDRHSQVSYIEVTKNEHLRVRVGCLAG